MSQVAEEKLARNNADVLCAVLDGLRLIRENGGHGGLEMDVRDGMVPFVKKIVRENLGSKQGT